jgi:hypothetical protein
MAERIEAAGPDGSTFTKPEGLLAHYTDASAAFEHILPTGKLHMSPYRLMRDPVENKDILPSIAWRGDPPDAGRAIDEVYAQLKAARDRMRVLSFTHDADRRAEYAGFDCCWSRPRMWEQYGDKHRGVCLLAECKMRGLARSCEDETPMHQPMHGGRVHRFSATPPRGACRLTAVPSIRGPSEPVHSRNGHYGTLGQAQRVLVCRASGRALGRADGAGSHAGKGAYQAEASRAGRPRRNAAEA